MPRRVSPEQHAEERRRLLGVASALLQAEGPDALSNRRIAKAAGTTTMTIYSRFGGKDGILDALFEEGVDRIAAAQDSVAPAAPLDELLALVLAYRRAALAFSGHYRLMFGQPIPGYVPSPDNRARLLGTCARLQRAVARLVPAEEAAAVTYEVFAACHGLVMLELAELTVIVPAPEALYRDAVRRLVR